jgi:hypothetical protein
MQLMLYAGRAKQVCTVMVCHDLQCTCADACKQAAVSLYVHDEDMM